ncbi:MAG: transposase [Kofleriaceae bacterium]
MFAQVQAEAAATRRSPAIASTSIRGSERLRAWCDGFSLHAAVVIADHDRDALERLCRYGARPAFAQDRPAWTADGRISYKLKRPWPDGRTHLVMEPVAFLRRLIGIIPLRAVTWFATPAFSGPPANTARSSAHSCPPIPIIRPTAAARIPNRLTTRAPADCPGPTYCAASSPTTSSVARAAGAAPSSRSSPILRSHARSSTPSALPPNPRPSRWQGNHGSRTVSVAHALSPAVGRDRRACGLSQR